jgi:hypothetical protein
MILHVALFMQDYIATIFSQKLWGHPSRGCPLASGHTAPPLHWGIENHASRLTPVRTNDLFYGLFNLRIAELEAAL